MSTGLTLIYKVVEYNDEKTMTMNNTVAMYLRRKQFSYVRLCNYTLLHLSNIVWKQIVNAITQNQML